MTPFSLETIHLLGLNAAIRQKPVAQIAEHADLGRLHQTTLCYRRNLRRSFFAAASVSGLCVARYKPFDKCNRLTAGRVVLLILTCFEHDLALDYGSYESFLDVMCQADTNAEDLAIYIAANSYQL